MMNQTFIPGERCRALRSISHQGGILRRGDEGTVFAMRENLGRWLVTVDFESKGRLVLFAHEIEPLAETDGEARIDDSSLQAA
jgi:hypothetical protein